MEKCSVQYLVISESMIKKKKGANYYEHISEDGTSSRRAPGGPSGGIPEDTVITGEDSSACWPIPVSCTGARIFNPRAYGKQLYN